MSDLITKIIVSLTPHLSLDELRRATDELRCAYGDKCSNPTPWEVVRHLETIGIKITAKIKF